MRSGEFDSHGKGVVKEITENRIVLQDKIGKYDEDKIVKFLYFMSDLDKGLIFSIILISGILAIGLEYVPVLKIPAIVFSVLFTIILFAYGRQRSKDYPTSTFAYDDRLEIEVGNEIEITQILKVKVLE